MKIAAWLTAAALFSVASPVAAADPTNTVIFGDSIVDSGNVAVATGGAVPSAAQGYFQGRFSNGYHFGDYLNIKLAGVATTASLLGGDNWAWGGSRGVGNAFGGFPTPGLPQQGADFLANGPRGATPNSLHILNFGGNDVFGLQSGDTGGLSPAQFRALYVSNMVSAVQTLDALGARNILVMGIPNANATGFGLDAQLQAALNGIEPGLTNATLYRFSYFSFYNRLLSDPASYGFTGGIITQSNCLADRPVINGRIDCTGYFSFDGTHFTTQVHRGIARDLVQVLGVPEPGTWALMIVGFGLTGQALRRRSVQLA